MGTIGLRGASRRMRDISVCDFLFFGFFDSPTGRYSGPIFTIYTSNEAFSRKEVPFGGLDDEFSHFPLSPPKFENLHCGLWQLQTAITRASLKIEASCLHQSGHFWGQAI